MLNGKWMKTAVAAAISFLVIAQSAYAAKVVIDPGHGGADPGAIGVNGLREKDVNLDISMKVKELLQNKGYDVMMTRIEDEYLSLQERVEWTREQKADLFVSIHANAHRSPSAHGTLVLYSDKHYPQKAYPASPEMNILTPESKKLATLVVNHVVNETGTLNQGIVPSAVYVVRMGNVPSILVETAFLSNVRDAGLLADDWMRHKFAKGIAAGIESYLPAGFTDIANHWAKDSINRLKDEGLAAGENNRFMPNRSLTRAEFLAFMDRVFHFSDQPAEQTQSTEQMKSAGPTQSTEPVDSDLRPYIHLNVTDSTVTGDTYGEPEPPLPPVSGHSLTESDARDGGDAGPPTNPTAPGNPVTPVTPTIPTMTDLAPTHWAYSVIEHAVKSGIIVGFPDGTVRPDQPISRAEVSVLFDRIWEDKQIAQVQVENAAQFNDVVPHAWYAESVYRMQATSLMNGIQDKVFAPNRNMTRAEMATVLDRYLLTQNI